MNSDHRTVLGLSVLRGNGNSGWSPLGGAIETTSNEIILQSLST
jgi:hypothetical protein